jgi:hydroxyacylglutathione hydrolase
MSSLEIEMFPCLSDNYGFLLHDEGADLTAAVDTPDVDSIVAALERKGWRLTHIFNTHHHMDHAGGNLRLKELTGCRIVGPRKDAARIPGIDVGVGQGDAFAFGTHRVEVLDTPGHTRGHIVYYLPDDGVAFVGDTLFMPDYGTARADFPGGDARTLYRSIQRILSLPQETRLFMCHDYKAPGRESFAWETTVAEQRARNVHVKDGIGEDEFVAMRTSRDKTLEMPVLILPSIQVNVRAGRLPSPEQNGVSYLKIPLNQL